MKKTLKSMLRDELIAKRVMTVDEVYHLADVNGFKPSSAERYLRRCVGRVFPHRDNRRVLA